jgi:hypothetical protein
VVTEWKPKKKPFKFLFRAGVSALALMTGAFFIADKFFPELVEKPKASLTALFTKISNKNLLRGDIGEGNVITVGVQKVETPAVETQEISANLKILLDVNKNEKPMAQVENILTAMGKDNIRAMTLADRLALLDLLEKAHGEEMQQFNVPGDKRSAVEKEIDSYRKFSKDHLDVISKIYDGYVIVATPEFMDTLQTVTKNAFDKIMSMPDFKEKYENWETLNFAARSDFTSKAADIMMETYGMQKITIAPEIAKNNQIPSLKDEKTVRVIMSDTFAKEAAFSQYLFLWTHALTLHDLSQKESAILKFLPCLTKEEQSIIRANTHFYKHADASLWEGTLTDKGRAAVEDYITQPAETLRITMWIFYYIQIGDKLENNQEHANEAGEKVTQAPSATGARAAVQNSQNRFVRE